MDSSKKAQVICPASWDMGNEFMKDGPKSFVETDDVLYNSNAHSDFNESNGTCAEDDFRDDKKLDVMSTRAHDEKRECSEKTNALLSQRKEKHDDCSNCDNLPIVSSGGQQGSIQIHMVCCVVVSMPFHIMCILCISCSNALGILACSGNLNAYIPCVSFIENDFVNLPKTVTGFGSRPLLAIIMSMVSHLMSENKPSFSKYSLLKELDDDTILCANAHIMAVTYWLNRPAVAILSSFTLEISELPINESYDAAISDAIIDMPLTNRIDPPVVTFIKSMIANSLLEKGEFSAITFPTEKIYNATVSDVTNGMAVTHGLGLPLSTSIMSVTAPLVSEYKGSHIIILPLEELYDVRLAVLAVSRGKFEGITFLIGESFKATSSDSSTRNALKYGFHHPFSTFVIPTPTTSKYEHEFLTIDSPMQDLCDSKISDAGTLDSVSTYQETRYTTSSLTAYNVFFSKYFDWHFFLPDVNNTLSMFKHKDNKQLDLANERILRKIGVSGPAGKVMLQLSSLVPYTLQPLVDGNDTNETKKQSGSKGQQSGSKQKQPQQTNGSFSYGTSASSTAGGGGGDDEDEDGRKRRRIQNHDSSDDDSDNDDSDEEEEEREETSNPGLNSRDEKKSASSSENPQIPHSADNTPSPIHLGPHANEINDGASTSRGTNAEIPIEEVNQISEHPSSIQVQRQANPDQPNGSLNKFGHKTRFIPDGRTVESDGPQPPPPPPVQSPPTNRVNESNGTSVRRNELPDFEQQMLGTLPGVRGLFAELPWTSRNEDERLQPTSQPDRLQLGPQSRDNTFTLRSERQENGNRIETWRWIPTTSAGSIASIHPNRQERPGRADMRESRRCPDCNEEILGIFTYCRNCARHICGLCWISHDCQRWF